MNIITIRAEYGKKHQYISSCHVMENAIDKYKEEIRATIKRRGWTKEVSFVEYNHNPFIAWDGKGTYGLIRAYTLNGYEYDVKVK